MNNKAFFAEGIKYYQTFADNLIQALNANGIEYHFLPHTDRKEHIWVRDYMPIQIGQDLFLRYRYSPDYLKGYTQYIPDYKGIDKALGLNCIETDIILDGGNVIQCDDKVIMTDKIFPENPQYSKSKLIGKLESLLNAELVLIPWDRYEMFGHADGMVRYLNHNRVVINHYIDFDPYLRKRLLTALESHFEIEELQYARKSKNAWAFLNYLQVKDCIFAPGLAIEESAQAIRQLQELFPEKKVQMVESAEEVVKAGGGLNCISWDIQ